MSIYIYGEYCSVVLFIKKNDLPPFVTTGRDLESIMLREVRQTEKDRYCVISLTCRIFKKQHQPKTGGCQRQGWGCGGEDGQNR